MFNYYGSKRMLSASYPAPDYPVTIEPFAGSAAYSVRHRRRTERVILIEKDPRVAGLWRRLLSMTAADLRSLPEPIAGEPSSELLVAFASARCSGDTPETFMVSSRMVDMYRQMLKRMASVVDQCRHFEIIEGDYTDAPDIEATWFIDPPYQPQGGRWDRDGGGRYRPGNREIDFDALASWCKGRRGQVIVCEVEGSTWLPWTGSVKAPVVQAHKKQREVWWTNRPPTTLFDYQPASD